VSQIANFDVLVPRFSPAYPSVLREYGINEGEWRGFIEHVNAVCMEAFDPFRWSNVAINILALLSCWLSEWIMPNFTKRVGSFEMLLIIEIVGLGKVY
jgi:Golgin subfamily A member 7/ERF4 family